jgi:hypothetical protein
LLLQNSRRVDQRVGHNQNAVLLARCCDERAETVEPRRDGARLANFDGEAFRALDVAHAALALRVAAARHPALVKDASAAASAKPGGRHFSGTLALLCGRRSAQARLRAAAPRLRARIGMGKASRRNRNPVGKTKPFVVPNLADAVESQPGEKFEKNCNVPNPIPGWKSYPEALAWLAQIYSEATWAPEFTPNELDQQMRFLLYRSELTISDKSASVPCGPNADWREWAKAGGSFLKQSEDPANANVAFLVLRTQANTPGYLGGSFYRLCSRVGEEAARKILSEDPNTPCGVLFRKGNTYEIPTIVSQCTVRLAAEIVVAILQGDDPSSPGFRCSICLDSLLLWNDEATSMSQFVASECDHAFHPACLLEVRRPPPAARRPPPAA